MTGYRMLQSVPAVAVMALALAWTPPARAHVGPDVDTNNRYLKLMPMGDRLRLVYVIYFGERPGAQARRRIDRDGDGTLSSRERDAFGATIAASVAANLSLALDGQRTPIEWSEIHIGMTDSATTAGSFSVDLVAWLCLDPRQQHRVVMRDYYRLQSPGETELRVIASPGVRSLEAHYDGEPPRTSFRWRDQAAPLAQRALTVTFTSDTSPAESARPGCAAADALPRAGLSVALIGLAALAAGLALAAALFALVRRRRRRRAT